ncbi:Wadjet anti-phage system protein JetD domain-containing protein [Gryllotalpicola protaetiae]|uniref:DUF3322 and DUF2220 domain-containing protein n=1 Tax=Gryllotalpicola protaetiae TaxID=2419771 RepID=A0A387BM45_9MICO|nr:Wadjet anti-phage system protein JetD domain-containing protein [Gryllotalpicola protaetiae]AYG03738.1 hypothetical protein D7I44_09445 [Gryllotalpicola protaetiae]
MITVAEARVRATARLRTAARSWAAGLPQPASEVALTFGLKPPSEKSVLSDPAAAEAWAREWSALDSSDDVVVRWALRSWARVGAQRVPESLTVTGADAIARFSGGKGERDWFRLQRRAEIVFERFGHDEAVAVGVRAQGGPLLELDDHTFETALDVIEWLRDNPVSGYRPRQLPIRGIDTKWLGSHRGFVMAFFRALTGAESLGLTEADRLVRVRVLDPALVRSGPLDFAAPPNELATLALRPANVLVFENLESVLAMPARSGTVVIHGAGYAVDALRAVPWVQNSRVIYWGDLDSNGFAILHRLRAGHHNVTSTLMDEKTLIAHRDLWVPEPTPARGEMPTLTTGERQALDRLRSEGNVRLEQERIPWAAALAALDEACAGDA